MRPPNKKRDARLTQNLKDAGWLVQDRDTLDLAAGRGVAACDFSMKFGFGTADYLLYVDRKGIGAVEVATRVGKSVLTVRRWRRRYASKGVDGLLKDATRPPGRKPLTARKIKQVVNLTLNDKPPDATHWSERTMAAAVVRPSS